MQLYMLLHILQPLQTPFHISLPIKVDLPTGVIDQCTETEQCMYTYFTSLLMPTVDVMLEAN